MLDWQNYIGGLINLNLSAKRLNGTIDQGSGTFVYYSFVDTEETIGTSFSSMSAVQRENTRLALNVYEKSSGLRFVELTDEMKEAGIAPQVSFRLNDMSPAGNAGTPFVTDTTVLTKYVTISDRADAMNEGSFYYGVLLHEIGHASGMRHPNIPDAYDHTDYTIMSYNGPIASTDIKIMDKFALQTHYGTSADMDHITYWQDGLNFMAQGDETNNRFIGVTGPNNIKGMGGNDLLGGRLGDDTLDGGDGNDTLDGSGGNDVLKGGSGADSLLGMHGNDTLIGGAGQDTLMGGNGDDYLQMWLGDDIGYGGAGNDTMIAATGNNVMYGEGGNDFIIGGMYHDRQDGGTGDDIILGGMGDDTIDGGLRNDRLFGSLGADTFILSDGTQRTKEIDHIYYYAKGEDTIEVTFVGLPVLIAKYQDENLHVTVGNTTTVIHDASWSDVTWDFQWA